MRSPLLLATALWVSAGAPGAFAEPGHRLPVSTAAFVSPSTAAYAAASGVINDIRIHRLNVFDPGVPGEDWWLFLLGNRIHVMSKEAVIEREVLLNRGGRWDALAALESERNLRASGFIRKAEIRPRSRADRKLDLDVYSQDSWTLAPQFSVGTEGGDRYFIYGIEENNLLGFGKTVSAYHSQVGPTIRSELRYRDPRLWGSRYEMTNLYARTSDGDEIGAQVDRPFFSLDTDFSMSALWTRIIQDDPLYQAGAQTTKFRQNYRSVQASVAAHVNDSQEPVQRILFGTHYEKNEFYATPDTAPGTLPSGRELSGPIVGYSLIKPRYIKETYINRMERVEDFNLGNELTLSGGPMLMAVGADRDRWIFSALDQQGASLGEGRFALGQAGAQGRLAGGRTEGAILYANLNLFWKALWPWPQTVVSHLEANKTTRIDGENQILLGGNTGLRGYKNNSFTGSRSVLLNFEDRVFLTREFFHLFYLGGAAFFETGAAIPDGAAVARNAFKSDVGAGLRLGPTRSTSGNVLRLDVAYALDQSPGPSRWVVSLRGGQAFEIFNSTNREILQSPASTVGESDAGLRLRRR